MRRALDSFVRDGARGDDTRRRLIEAAIEVFAETGFDGASTRELAARAKTNLAAIPYHFGGKAGLYRAAAHHIADGMLQKLGPALAEAETALAGSPSRPELARLFDRLVVKSFAAALIGSEEAGKWCPFVLREQMRPGEAFEIIYNGFIARMQNTCAGLVARLLRVPKDDPRTIVRATAIIGQILVFRVGRAALLKRTGWPELGKDNLELIQAVLSEDLERIVTRPATASRAGKERSRR
jgi:TetR/AcrR family transcriptional regulator, regulator of cefoperazone and chloramphenicol sensitivity